MNGKMLGGMKMVYLRGWGWVGFGVVADVVAGVVELALPAVGVVVLLPVSAWPSVVACYSNTAAGVALALRSPLLPGSLPPPCSWWMGTGLWRGSEGR